MSPAPTNTSALVVPKVMPDGSTVMLAKFEWTGAQEQAAVDVAEGVWRKREIADRANVETGAVTAWMRHPEFQARVDELCAEMRERVKYIGLARKEVRIAAAYERWVAMRQVIKERSEAAYEVAGGASGMLAHDQKQIGSGENAQIVDEYKFDSALNKELRELEKQIAIEMGDWTEKKEMVGAGGGPIQIQAIALAELCTPDELETLRRRAQERAASVTVAQELGPVVEVTAVGPVEEFPI